MKICTICKIDKPDSDFNWKIKDLTLQYACKECHNKYKKEWYIKNKVGRIKVAADIRKRNAEYARKAKEKPCADCGIQYPYYVMQYDHNPEHEKKFNLSENRNWGINQIKNEMSKCDIVCANCHFERTYKRKLAK